MINLRYKPSTVLDSTKHKNSIFIKYQLTVALNCLDHVNNFKYTINCMEGRGERKRDKEETGRKTDFILKMPSYFTFKC